MSTEVSQEHDAFHASDGIFTVPDTSARSVLINRLRDNLITVKIRDADSLNDQSRDLLQQYIDLMQLDEQEAIQGQMNDIDRLEKRLEDTRSPFRKFLLVRQYKRVSRETYLIVKKASNRLRNDQIKERLRAATDPQGWPTFPQEPAPRSNGGSFTAPVFPVATPPGGPPINHFGNAFTSPHVASALDAATCSDLERVEMTKFQSMTTGDPAVLLGLHGRDVGVQHFFATLANACAQPEHRSDEQGETSTIHSSEIFSEPGIYA